MFLTSKELQELTGYVWLAKQRQALREMGIPFRVNPRGRILVERAAVQQEPAQRERQEREPNWEALKVS